MEKLVIQPDIKDITAVDNFVKAICDRNRIINYYATISIPVRKAVENAIQGGSTFGMSILFSYCQGGFAFTVQCGHPCFYPIRSDQVPSAGSLEESAYLINVLSDRVEILDEGCTLRMTFNVKGIDADEAFGRAQTLKQFYARIRFQEAQSVEL